MYLVSGTIFGSCPSHDEVSARISRYFFRHFTSDSRIFLLRRDGATHIQKDHQHFGARFLDLGDDLVNVHQILDGIV